MTYDFFRRWLLAVICFGLQSCKSEKDSVSTVVEIKPPGNSYQCVAPLEQSDYKVYPLTNDAVRIGDVMPYFDEVTGQFNVYFLKDIWYDATHQRHPWYGLRTSDFYTYAAISAGEVLSSSNNPCSQDYAIGTGGIIKKGGTYYAFYTGHNPNYPSNCVTTKEGVMLATSTSLNSPFVKNTSFSTIYAPANQDFDLNDNFRDPFVYFDETTNKYYMILAARRNVNGVWKGVVPYYTSDDLLSWTYQGILYDGGPDNFFMLETPEIFKMGANYYLLFSDIDSKNLFYRKSASLTGNWQKPSELSRFEGKGIYAAKTAVNKIGDRYLFGWTYVQEGNSDAGKAQWGGNLVVHKIFPKANGDLAVAIPHTLKSYLGTNTHPLEKYTESGEVTATKSNSYTLGNTAKKLSTVVFNPVNLNVFKINATVSFSSASKDFGFMIGVCDDTENFYSLRFVPSQSKFSLDKVSRSQVSTIVANTEVPLNILPNTEYAVQIVIENSMLVVYINNEVALSTRNYKATNTHWGIFSDNSIAKFDNITITKP